MSEAPLLVIAGPTAAGKSDLAMAACERLGGEIVSADSVQVYRGLDVGSAKPTAAEQARIRHHCLDAFDVTERCDAGRWLALAEAAVADIRGRGLRPVVCGGTGLYLRALLFGLAPTPAITPEVRAAVLADLEARGPEALHADLAAIDPAAAARLAPRDRQRIARALEVFRQTGRPLSAYQAEHGFDQPRHRARVCVLCPDPAAHAARLRARAARMLDGGMIAEVAALLAAGVPADAPGLSTLGYRAVASHLRGELPHDQLLERIVRGHRRYAKRQRTWFRRVLADDPSAIALDPDAPEALDADLIGTRGGRSW